MRPLEFGHDLEIHAPHAGQQCGRQEHSRENRQDANDAALLDIDDAKHGIEQESDLVREVRGVIQQ
jgi:hypothetical protein